MAVDNFQTLQFLLLSFLLLFMKIHCSSEDELYIIRSTAAPDLVLDGTVTSQVRLQNLTKANSQLWQFERGERAGLYYIANNQTKNVLAFVQHDLPDLATIKRKDGLDQQWSLTLNGHIVNAANRQNIDIWKANFTAGNRLIGANDYGNQAQEFTLEVVSARTSVDWCKYLLR